MLNNSRAAFELVREPGRIGDRAKIAIQNHVSLIGAVLLAASGLTNDILRAQGLQKARLRAPAKMQDFYRQRM